MLLQKNKNKFNLIAAIDLTILGLIIFAYPVNSQKSESATQQQTDINLVIQVGAFVKKTNATVFKEKLAAIIDKPVIMVSEEGYHKVQLTGFKNIEEIEKIIPALGLVGIRDFWIPPAKKPANVAEYAELQTDTIEMLPEEKIVNSSIPMEADSLVIEETPVDSTNIYALEIGAFRKKNKAINAQRKVISKLNLSVEIVTQWDRHHVIITGLNNKTDINRYLPELARLGYDEIFVIKNFSKQVN